MHYGIGKWKTRGSSEHKVAIVQMRLRSRKTECTLEECHFLYNVFKGTVGDKISVKRDPFTLMDEHPSETTSIAFVADSFALFAVLMRLDLTSRRNAIRKVVREKNTGKVLCSQVLGLNWLHRDKSRSIYLGLGESSCKDKAAKNNCRVIAQETRTGRT